MANTQTGQLSITTPRFKDKVVIITGGSMGIGEGCVRVFVQHGSKAVFCDTAVDAGQALEQEMNQKGFPGEAFYFQCDVTKEDEIKCFINKTTEKFGRIDCLVNNAGTHPPAVFIDDISGDDFRALFELNVMGYFFLSKYALPHLRKTQGSIINNASLVGQIGQLGAISYVSSKGAISAMTRALAIDEAKHGVRVNAISPGNVWTPLWESQAKLTPDKNMAIQEGMESQLNGRFGTIEEAGKLCLFLAAEATFCTGIDIPLSGGAELNYGRKAKIGTD